MKEVTRDKRGMREEQYEMTALGLDENGNLIEERFTQTVQVMSKARRIRYTRHFFPASTAELRLRLFSGLGDANDIAVDQTVAPDTEDDSSQEQVTQPGDRMDGDESSQPAKQSWALYEHNSFSRDIQDYRDRRQTALVESLTELNAGKPMYSRRILSVWAYQRKRLGAKVLQSKQGRNGHA